MAGVSQYDLPVSRANPAEAAAAETPARDLDRTIAHLWLTCEINTAHLDRHVAAAQAATTADSLAHNLRHARNHVAVTSEHQGKLLAALSRRVPAVSEAAGQLNQAISGGLRKSGADLDRGLSHDLSSATVAAGHVDRHLAEAQAAPDPASVKFNLEHAATHAREIAHYHGELRSGLAQRLPAVIPELDKLCQAAGLGSYPAIPPAPATDRSADYDVTRSRPGPEPA